jgi:hypothetical protein
MVRLSSRPVAFTLLALGALISGAQAFPMAGTLQSKPWHPFFRAHGFGVIDPGECRFVHEETIDSSYRVRDRLNMVCD